MLIIYDHLVLRSRRIVRFLVFVNISWNLSITRSSCLISSSGFGFYLNLTVFRTHLSNYFPRQWAASISMLESPKQIKLVSSYVQMCNYMWIVAFQDGFEGLYLPSTKISWKFLSVKGSSRNNFKIIWL